MKHRRWVVAGILLVPALALGWWLGSPLFLDETVEEAFPYSERATVPDGMDRREVEQVMAGMAKVDAPAAEPMPEAAAPALRARGAFRDADSFHRGSGDALVYELPSGELVLRLEGFRVTNGPALHVLLARGADPADSDELGDYLDLGPLKGNIGNQNYAIPAGTPVEEYGSVVIYCRPFHVVFSVASLDHPG